ncbi:MAG TPA: hypothetical protein VHF46_07450 [Rubrobacteraceae bacterium]|nr:hypothetical protein [Rubrobacteraceae bacterium]
MQEEKTPYYAAQEPNDALDLWGVAANLEGFEEFDQDPSGEEPADVAASKRLAPWLFGAAAEEASSSSTPVDPEADPFVPEGLAAESEDPAASADLSDPALYDTGVGDPWGTPPPGTVEQEGGAIFTPPWENPNAQPPGTAGQEEGSVFNPLFTASWEDLGVPSPGTTEQEGESIFTPPWESLNAQPPETAGQEEEPAFAAPWEYDSTAPDLDTNVFSVGWDNLPDAPPEGQQDVANAGYEKILQSFDVWSEPNGMAGETMAAEDIWKDTAEGPIEDASGAFEDVSEIANDFFDSL